MRSFQLHLIEVRKVGWSSFNQAVCGLRFLFRTTYPRRWVVSMVPFGKRPKKLPAVLGGEEVANLLSCVSNIKHRTVLLTLYAAGLRLNEGRTADCRCELPLGYGCLLPVMRTRRYRRGLQIFPATPSIAGQLAGAKKPQPA